MSDRPARGIALLYHRDSDGAAECAPAGYVDWGRRRAAELGVTFDGTPEQIDAMIRRRVAVDPPIYLDYGISGNELRRPGLDALIRDVRADRRVTHVFCPRRDRLARPDQAVEGLLIEYEILRAGVALVLLNRVVPPLRRGQRQDVGELVAALLEYHYSGEFRPELAEKLSRAQLQLARAGFSMGGTPPYGFRRWLVREADHHPVRELTDGERTKLAGHHVCWLPTDEPRLAVVRRIVDRLEAGARAAEVARELTADGVPVPGRRSDASGVWHPTTIRGLAVSPLLRAVVESGRRVEGTERRFSATGPRPLADADYRADGRPRAVANPPEARVAVPARGFDPVIEPARHAALVAELDARGASQRGKPRARAGTPNPLGGRIWDAGCTWPMYRHARGPAYRYVCSKYVQSNARECSHNWVDGPAATRFVLAAARQWLLSPVARAKLRAKLERLAAAEAGADAAAREAEARRVALAAARQKMDRAAANLALAETEAQYKAVAAQFERFRGDHDRLAADLEAAPAPSTDPEAEVAAALAVLDRLPELGGDDDTGAARQLFEQLDARLYLRFRPEPRGRQVVSKPVGGVLTFGTTPPPVPVYTGRTDKAYLKQPTAAAGGVAPPVLPPCSCGPGAEDGSSGNRQRVTPRCT